MHKATVCFVELVNVLYYVFKQGNQGAAFLWGELYVPFSLSDRLRCLPELACSNSEEGQIYLVTGARGAGGPQRQPAARTQRRVLCLQSCSWGFQGRSVTLIPRSMISRLRPALKAAQKSWGVTLGSSPFPFPRDCSSHHHTPWVPNIISSFLF